MDVFSKTSCGSDGWGVGSGAGSTASVHEDTNVGLRGRESEVGEIESEGVNLCSGSGMISTHEAENEGGARDNEVGVIEVVDSWPTLALSSVAVAEGAGICRISEGDSKNKGESEEC